QKCPSPHRMRNHRPLATVWSQKAGPSRQLESLHVVEKKTVSAVNVSAPIVIPSNPHLPEDSSP
ncbi:MAG: hypothetical protein ACP5ON_06110, partial [Bacteroidota bacterium]